MYIKSINNIFTLQRPKNEINIINFKASKIFPCSISNGPLSKIITPISCFIITNMKALKAVARVLLKAEFESIEIAFWASET